MDMKLPRTVAVVVNSPVLGSTAVSVPTEAVALSDDAEKVHLVIMKRDVRNLVEEREQRYKAGRARQHGGRRPTDIPAAPLRQAAYEQVERGTSWYELAARCGWYKDSSGQADVKRLKKALGQAPYYEEDKHIRYETAVLITNALNLDPVEVGL